MATAYAAQLGTMKVTEQIDALVTLSTNPMKYLTVPRVIAATLCVPLLVGVGDAVGIMGGYLVGTTRLGFNEAVYLKYTVEFLQTWDVETQRRNLSRCRGNPRCHRAVDLLSG